MLTTSEIIVLSSKTLIFASQSALIFTNTLSMQASFSAFTNPFFNLSLFNAVLQV